MHPEASDEATSEAPPTRELPSLTPGRILMLLAVGVGLMILTCPFTGILLIAESGQRVAPVPLGATVIGAVGGGALAVPFLLVTRRKLLSLIGAMGLGALLGRIIIPFIVG